MGAGFHAVIIAGPSGNRASLTIDYLIVAIGVGIMVFSTFISIQTWSTSTFNACLQ